MTKVEAIDRIVFAVLGVIALLLLLQFGDFTPSEGERAAEAYEAARNSGASGTQLCRSAQVVEIAHRTRGEASKADQWKMYASNDCAGASLKEGYHAY